MKNKFDLNCIDKKVYKKYNSNNKNIILLEFETDNKITQILLNVLRDGISYCIVKINDLTPNDYMIYDKGILLDKEPFCNIKVSIYNYIIKDDKFNTWHDNLNDKFTICRDDDMKPIWIKCV